MQSGELLTQQFPMGPDFVSYRLPAAIQPGSNQNYLETLTASQISDLYRKTTEF